MKKIEIIFPPSLTWSYLFTSMQLLALTVLVYIVSGIDYLSAFIMSFAVYAIWLVWRVTKFKEQSYIDQISAMGDMLLEKEKQVIEVLTIAENKSVEVTQKHEGIASLLLQVTEKEKEVTELKKTVTSLATQVTELEKQVSASNPELTAELTALTNQVTALTTKCNKQAEVIERRESQIREIQNELRKVGEERKVQEIGNLKRSLSQYIRAENYEKADEVKRKLISLGVDANEL